LLKRDELDGTASVAEVSLFPTAWMIHARVDGGRHSAGRRARTGHGYNGRIGRAFARRPAFQPAADHRFANHGLDRWRPGDHHHRQRVPRLGGQERDRRRPDPPMGADDSGLQR